MKSLKSFIKQIESIFNKTPEIITKEERELLDKLKECTITDGVYNHYVRYVRDKQDASHETVKKLLIRNIILSKEAIKDKYNPTRRLFYYGSLSIIYDENLNQIVWIKNYKYKKIVDIDKNKKRLLNKELGIVNNIPSHTYMNNKLNSKKGVIC